MSLPKRASAPSRALLSALRRPCTSPYLQRTSIRTSDIGVIGQQRWESTEGHPQPRGDGKSFRGQLYSSTAMRLQREKAERERFSNQRNEKSGGKSLALTFGMFDYFEISQVDCRYN